MDPFSEAVRGRCIGDDRMMTYQFCFFFSVLCCIATVVIVIAGKYKPGRLVTPLRCAIVLIFAAGIALYYPLLDASVQGTDAAGLKNVLASMFNSWKLFFMGYNPSEFIAFSPDIGGRFSTAYFLLSLVLGVGAPLTSLNVILSLFQNFKAYRKLYLHIGDDIYVFSRLSPASAALAESIKKEHPKCLTVFTDVKNVSDESASALYARAQKMNAAVFSRDIDNIEPGFNKYFGRFTFMVMDDDADENIRHTLALVKKYGTRKNFALNVFTNGLEDEILLQDLHGLNMQVRRINKVRAFVNHTIYTKGVQLFRGAVEDKNGRKNINAVIIGLGKNGTEMLKALIWCCQMDGYYLTVDVFDRQADAAERFRNLCPEIMSERYNGVPSEQEPAYNVFIHSGCDVHAAAFDAQFSALKEPTFVFVSLGDDSDNISASVQIKRLSEKKGQHPYIQTVVYDSFKANKLMAVSKFKGVKFNLDIIGRTDEFFSVEVLLNTELDREALRRHQQCGYDTVLYSSEENYYASVASVIHLKLRKACGLPGCDLPVSQRTPEQRKALAVLEHKRWMAYIRTEGYVYTDVPLKDGHDHFRRYNNYIIPYDDLPESEKIKNDV